MKSINIPILLVLSLLACDPSFQATAKETAHAGDQAELVTATLHVEGMTCKSCENAIKTDLNKLAGVKEVLPSHKESKVVVKFEKQKISLNEITAAITNLGYTIK